MPGEEDLARMLASLDVEQRPGTFTFVHGHWPGLRAAAHAIVEEAEGPTLVVEVDEFTASWLTLQVWSSLASTGLTAAVSAALAAEGIACNTIAGYYHDHLLVPADRTDDAVRVLRALSSR